MRSDDELERLLEDWLEDEAQPIPRDVLEGTLESVYRTSQVGPLGGGAGWFRNGRFGMAVAAGLVLLAILTGVVIRDRIGSMPTPSASAGPVQVWAQPDDFHAAPALNPGPDAHGNAEVWSYLAGGPAHDPAAYDLLPTFSGSQWMDPAYVNLNVHEDRGLVLHPSIEVEPTYIILGWRSPISGEVTIAGSADLLQRNCSQPANGVRLFIDDGSHTLSIEDVPAGSTVAFELRATVGFGDSIYFVVDPAGNSSCDSTALTVTITSQP